MIFGTVVFLFCLFGPPHTYIHTYIPEARYSEEYIHTFVVSCDAVHTYMTSRATRKHFECSQKARDKRAIYYDVCAPILCSYSDSCSCFILRLFVCLVVVVVVLLQSTMSVNPSHVDYQVLTNYQATIRA